MYLLDTNVLSELRKAGSGRMDPKVGSWAQSVSSSTLYLSAVSIMELEIGILLLERRDRSQGAVLRAWMDEQVLATFHGRVLAVDTPIALKCATLNVPTPRSDRDAMIAATAMVHRMKVVTRNVSHFAPTGVGVVDPWNT
jgi:predicted nucleic acid-binding protein